MTFVQIVEFKTSRIDEMRERGRRFQEETGGGGSTSAIVCADRDNEGRYFIIAQFPSYEEAMKNSEAPETQALAADMAKLGDGPPTFYNLDLLETF
jgi:quinol monooxygenase YgiN